MITISNLFKYLKSSTSITKAIDGVSLEIIKGETLGIIGESGSGKSTLAKIMAGLLKADKGEIHRYQTRVQMVFQDPYASLDPLWTVDKILKEAFMVANKVSKIEQEVLVQEILKQVGLIPDMLQRYPHEFSGGQRQRIAIARALLAKPDILILDEAVSALDTLVALDIMNVLNRIKKDKGITYIFISHNLRLAKGFSDRIAVMYQGKIVETGSTDEILCKPKVAYTKELINAAFNYV